MVKKKNVQISASQAENTQAQGILEHYQQIVATLRASMDQQQVEAALAEVNALPENVQIALLKELAREQQVDAADLLAALYEFATLKTVRKEARRSLIRLEGAKIYPRWQPPVEQAPALGTALQPSTNPPRFWKGFVTDSREIGEVNLMLAWQQGEDYKEVRFFSFLLEFRRDGVRDFFTELASKRSFENYMNQVRNHLSDVKLKDCSLAEGRRLLREALAVNTKHSTKPHRDYQLHISLVNQLILEAPGMVDESLLDEEEEIDEEDLDELQGLLPTSVVSCFIEYWVDGEYDMAYQLLAQDSPLREGLSMDEWVERRENWAETFGPYDLKPGLLSEREVPKSKLWRSRSSAQTPATREVEVAWSVELDQTPMDDDQLPELPVATRSYEESGRHWFWASFTLVREGEEWRIQSMSDEGALARELTIEELEKRATEMDKIGGERAKQYTPEQLERMDEEKQERYTADVLQFLLRKMYYLDALLTKKPLDRKMVDDLINYMLLLSDFERGIVYLMHLLEHFPEEQAKAQRGIATFQQRRSEELFDNEDGEDDDLAEHFLELAEKTLLDSLAIEDNADAHISLAEMFVEEGERLDEAESHLLQAKNLATDPEYEAHIEMHLGEVAMAREEYQEALKHYQRRAELLPTDADPWFDIGGVYQELENVEEAAASYRRAIELAPDDNAVYYATLSSLYQNNHQSEQAVQVLEEGMRVNPNSAELLAHRAITYAEDGNYQQAGRLLDKAEMLDPENEIVRLYQLVYEQAQSTFSPPKKFAGTKKKGRHHH